MKWMTLFVCAVLMLACVSRVAHGFFGIRNGGSARNKRSLGDKGELWMLGDDRNNAIAGSTAAGICNVTSPTLTSKIDFNASNLVIKDFHGTPLPADSIVPISKTAVRFTIKDIQKSQYGKYKCYYKRELIYDRWIYVGVKPMEPYLNLTNQDAVLVYNWQNMTINISPTIAQQNDYTHDLRDTDVRLSTKCQIWYNWSIAVTGWPCSASMPYTKCTMNLTTCTCKVPQGVYRDLSGRRPPNNICIKAVCWNDAFGNSSAVFTVDLAQRVKPAPVNLSRVTPIDSRSVEVEWQKGHHSYELLYTVTFRATKFDDERLFKDVSTTSLDVTDLIPHGEYDVQITARPKYGGFESDPTAAVVIMLSDVPAENPQLLATDIVQYGGGEKEVALYWKEIPEKKRNGVIEIQVTVRISDGSRVQKRSSSETKRLPGNQISYSHKLNDDKSYVFQLEAVSTSHGRNTSLKPTELPLDQGDEAPFVFVEAIKDQNDQYVNVTWENPSWMDGEDIIVIYCEAGKDKECNKMSPLKTMTVPAAKRLVRVKNSNVYRIGLLRPTPGKPGLVKWSRCIYKQNAVPDKPPPLNLRPKPKKVELQVKAYPCEETLAKVVRVEGTLCRTSDEKTCSGESRPINISEGEFSMPHVFPVDHPGSHYMVRAQAVSSSGGRSPEGMDVIYVAPDENTDNGGIVGGATGGVVVILFIIGLSIIGYKQYRKTRQHLSVTRTPGVPVVLHDGDSDQDNQYDGVQRGENAYESLLEEEEQPPGTPSPDHNETPPPLPARDTNLSNSANTSGGATNSSGFHSGTMATGMTGEESADEETGGMSALSTTDCSGCYAPGVVQILPTERKHREIPMSVFKNNSACSEPSREADSSDPVQVEDDNSRGHPMCILPDQVAIELNSRDSLEANTSRDTDDLGSASAVGSSRDYAQVALHVADQPAPHILPAIQDEFAIKIAPAADTSTQGEKSSPENVVEEQVYRPCGPRGLLS